MIPRSAWFRKRSAWVAILLLPALLYRAAIPAGLMPVVDSQGRIHLEVCPGVAADMPVGGEHAHHHHHGGNPDASKGQDHAPCLFAVSAVSAPPPLLIAVSIAAPVPEAATSRTPPTVSSRSVVRAQTARAPPRSPEA